MTQKTPERAHIETRRLPLSSLKPAGYNPRTISDEALKGLAASIAKFGLVQPIVWNKRTGNVVSGHQRLSVLQQQGAVDTDVVVVDLDDIDEKALNVTANNPHISGQFNEELQPLLDELEPLCDEFEGLRLDELEKITQRDVEVDDGGEEEDIPEFFRIVIDCNDETDQSTLYERLQQEGYNCRLLMS